MNFLKKLWSKHNPQQQEERPSKKDTYFDIIISLTKDKQIDFSLFLDDKIEDKDMTIFDYSSLCSEFLNAVLSNNLKKDGIDILNRQIKNKENEILIDSIITLMKIVQKKQETPSHKTFIKPSEVFAKYNI